ncbi:MAG: hypothetical protein OEM39_05145, partial [Acidimicrobiia bacterium]|nr:hypothetical protein [Acidimicrobiia bacterium]
RLVRCRRHGQRSQAGLGILGCERRRHFQDQDRRTPLVAGAGGDDCLVGERVLDDEALFEELAAEFAGEEGFSELTAGDGELTASFDADGTVSAVRPDWGFSVASDDGIFKIRIDGDQSGTWETDGSTLMLVLDGGSGFVTSTPVEIDGEEFALPTSPINLPAESL